MKRIVEAGAGAAGRFWMRIAGGLRIALLGLALLAGASASADDAADRHVDPVHGFSFDKPRFAPSNVPDVTTVAVTLAGSPAGGFASNVNVIVHNVATTLADYQALQAEQLRATGWEIIAQSPSTVAGTPRLRTHARGVLQGLELEFLALALIGDDEKVYTLTCTSTVEQFTRFRPECDRALRSFALRSDTRGEGR